VMGEFIIPSYLKSTGWVATSVMLCVSLGVFFIQN
jgi:hypothetical protein